NAVGVPASTIKSILDRSRELQDQLLTAGESNPALRQSYADALIEMTGTWLRLGDTQSALATAKQAREILEDLLRQQPDSTDLRNDLGLSNREFGDVQKAQGDLAGALQSYRQSLAILERLVKSNPRN